MSYPVVGEIWSALESTLLIQGKCLVEDIAKHYNSDPKTLWAKIKPQIKIEILDVELSEPSLCSHFAGNTDGAIHLRCRSPCLIGFDACSRHINISKDKNLMHSTHSTHSTHSENGYDTVERVLDHTGQTYFLDKYSIARDKNGKPCGHVKEGVLILFDTPPPTP